MNTVDISQATFIAGLVVANIGALISGYVSIKVALARLEVKVDKLEIDVNNLGDMVKKGRNYERNRSMDDGK